MIRFEERIRKLKKMGIARRVTLVYAVMIGLIIFVFGQIYLHMHKSEVLNRAQNYAESSLEYVALNIETNMDTMRQIALTVMSDKELMELITIKEEATARILLESKDSIERLSGYCVFNPQIKDVKVYYRNHNLEQIPPAIIEIKELEKQNWYPEFSASNELSLVCFSPDKMKMSNDTQKDIISLYSKIIYRYRTLDAVIKIDMKTDDFLSYRGENAGNYVPQFFLWKEEGIMAAGELTDLKRAEQIAEEVLMKKNEESFAVSYKYMESVDAWLVSFVDTDEILNTQIYFQWLVAGILLFTVVILYLIVSYIISRMLHRLVRLQKIMQSGEMMFDASSFGNDEIGELAEHFQEMLDNIGNLIEKNTSVQINLKNAEIQALQAQINSHFMYNTLESIGMLAVIHDDADTAEAIGLMGKIMRYDLDWSKTVVQLGDELGHVQNYVELMNIRRIVQEQNVEIFTNINEELRNIRVPKMILQPIVENAVQYSTVSIGNQKNIKISITACKIEEDVVAIDVVDNGNGILPEEIKRINNLMKEEKSETISELSGKTGIGLVNINRRLQLYYGDQYGIYIDSVYKTYTRVRLLIPYHMEEIKR